MYYSLHPQHIPQEESVVLPVLGQGRTGWFWKPLKHLCSSLMHLSYSKEAADLKKCSLDLASWEYTRKTVYFEKDCKKLTLDFASIENTVTVSIIFTMIKIRIYALNEINSNINSLNKLLSRNVFYVRH